ncbi:MAG: dihydrofolate reductase family protein [Opitutaceae bacterium]|jgi:dihydrofolate reductase
MAKKVTLYIATSLDGFIARPDGAVDWLPVPEAGGEDYGYGELLETADTLLMGRKTYEQCLGFGPWPYGGRRCVVFSGTRGGQRDARAEFVDCDIAAFVRELNQEPGDAVIWLVGGAEIIAACLAGGVVDEIILTIVPVLLGEGIRLFPETNWSTRLRLAHAKVYADGLVQQTYTTALERIESFQCSA